MMDQKKSFVHLLMLLLFLSFLLSIARPELMRARVVGEAKYQALSRKEIRLKRSLVHANERMDIEINDYPGSGANSRHDPRNPGRP
ncbi:uncharacterized protein LOC144547426 [Carex rostrata]